MTSCVSLSAVWYVHRLHIIKREAFVGIKIHIVLLLFNLNDWSKIIRVLYEQLPSEESMYSNNILKGTLS